MLDDHYDRCARMNDSVRYKLTRERNRIVADRAPAPPVERARYATSRLCRCAQVGLQRLTHVVSGFERHTLVLTPQ